jgi:hypothetical protein
MRPLARAVASAEGPEQAEEELLYSRKYPSFLQSFA